MVLMAPMHASWAQAWGGERVGIDLIEGPQEWLIWTHASVEGSCDNLFEQAQQSTTIWAAMLEAQRWRRRSAKCIFTQSPSTSAKVLVSVATKCARCKLFMICAHAPCVPSPPVQIGRPALLRIAGTGVDVPAPSIAIIFGARTTPLYITRNSTKCALL